MKKKGGVSLFGTSELEEHALKRKKEEKQKREEIERERNEKALECIEQKYKKIWETNRAELLNKICNFGDNNLIKIIQFLVTPTSEEILRVEKCICNDETQENGLHLDTGMVQFFTQFIGSNGDIDNISISYGDELKFEDDAFIMELKNNYKNYFFIGFRKGKIANNFIIKIIDEQRFLLANFVNDGPASNGAVFNVPILGLQPVKN